MKKIPVKELDAILAEVSAQLEPVVKAEVQKAAEKLSKAIPGEGTTDEVPKDASATKEAPDDKADAPPSEDKGPPAAEPKADEPPAAEPPAAEPPAAEPPVAEDGLTDPGADGDIDSPEALEAAYSALPLEELQVHYIAVRAAVMAKMPQPAPAPEAPLAAPPVAAPPVAAPPVAAPPVAAPPAPAAPMADPAFKAEMPADPNGSVEAVKKSEKTIEELTKKLNDQNKVIAELIDLSAALKKHAERPLRKSATSISEVRRGAPATATVEFASLNKSEVKALVRKTIEKQLSPNDRQRMHDFINSKYEDVESVKDLLGVA